MPPVNGKPALPCNALRDRCSRAGGNAGRAWFTPLRSLRRCPARRSPSGPKQQRRSARRGRASGRSAGPQQKDPRTERAGHSASSNGGKGSSRVHDWEFMCGGRTSPMAVRELPRVAVARSVHSSNAYCDATHAEVGGRRCLATRSETDARALVTMPGGRGAHRSDLFDAVRHDDPRQARRIKGVLRAGDRPAAGQRCPNRESR